MTQDFRQPSSQRLDSTPVAGPEQASVPPLHPNQRVVLAAIQFAAVIFAVAGLWLLLAEQSLFDAQVAPLVGTAFLIAAVFDVITVALLRRVWARMGRGVRPPGA